MENVNLNIMQNYYNEYPDERNSDCKVPDVNRIENPFEELNNSEYRSNILEFWKPITEKEVEGIDKNRYWISSYGNTWDALMYKPISSACSAGNKFYVQLNLHMEKGGHKTRKLHRLMMMLFCPVDNPAAYQVNHIDGIHNHNNLYNLEWCDDLYNRLHSIVNGVGTNNFNNEIIQLSPEQVHQFKVYKDSGYSSRDIYYNLMPELKSLTSFDTFIHLLSRISLGQSKLYSRYYY